MSAAIALNGGTEAPEHLPDGWWHVMLPTNAVYMVYVVDGLIVTSVMGIEVGSSFQMWRDVWTKWGWRIAHFSGGWHRENS